MSARRIRTVFTSDARQELSDILLYSGQQWGRSQRSAYKRLIQETIRTLSVSPSIGRNRDELSPGLQSHPVGSHVIYYWSTDFTLIVAHILHSRRDTKGKLWDPSDDSAD